MIPFLRLRLLRRLRVWAARALHAVALWLSPSTLAPAPQRWPAYGPDSYQANNALALLLVADIVHPMGGEGEAPPVMVGCNDLFFWGCADAEPLPFLGFGREMEAPFWDLYARVRRDGSHGAEVWCCLRRQMRPQTPIEAQWRQAGRWTAELEALPARDPKEGG